MAANDDLDTCPWSAGVSDAYREYHDHEWGVPVHDDRRLFDELPRGAATLSPEELGPTLLEPHPSWMTRIEAEWQRRYSR